MSAIFSHVGTQIMDVVCYEPSPFLSLIQSELQSGHSFMVIVIWNTVTEFRTSVHLSFTPQCF